jgi:hypothetical protein
VFYHFEQCHKRMIWHSIFGSKLFFMNKNGGMCFPRDPYMMVLPSHSQILRKTAHSVMAISVEEVELSSVRLLEALHLTNLFWHYKLISSVKLFCFLFSMHCYLTNLCQCYKLIPSVKLFCFLFSMHCYLTNLFWCYCSSLASRCLFPILRALISDDFFWHYKFIPSIKMFCFLFSVHLHFYA